ncbi:phytoene/squalene synthase family protein [Nitratireductor sp. ZSWI3]|uniref:phytoene/squalene synthase family protein n=1 Tax=Nitratireductor sp. ZSWI3 TaxID=2966359 RepID=UPI00215043EA|nr:phytoene/squalene synthase family protein [Nitratireductor sp. ZSWI3]MCR4267536.1 phytoene/squalene synthase family protein [Nitratireductor sp. ZSWI3]
MESDPHYAMSVVREADADRYISVLYAPQDKRAALFALYAFNAELAGIRDRVSEPLPGAVRLQFWRDVLTAGAASETIEGAPIAVALLEAVRAFRLPVQPLLDLIDAREFDLYDDPMPSRNDLEGYCGETASALIQMAGLVLDAPAAMRMAELAGHAGCAQAIAGLLRLLPIHRRRGQCYVPADLLQAAGTSREALLVGEEGAARAVAAMVALGRDHASRFEEGARGLPAALRPAFLPAGLARAYLDRITGKEAKALDKSLTIPQWRKHWLMFNRAMRGWN